MLFGIEILLIFIIPMLPQLDYCTINNHKVFNIKYSTSKKKQSKKYIRKKIYILHINVSSDIDNEDKGDNIFLKNKNSEGNIIQEKEDFIKEENKNNFIEYDNGSQYSSLFDTPKQVHDNELQTTSTNNKKKHLDKNIDFKIKIDRRFKYPEDLKEEFKIEKFVTDEDMKREFVKRKDSVNYLESRFKCNSCFKGFRENKLLEMHLIKHDVSSGKYICKICGIHSATSKQYRTHRDGNHTAKFSCNSCEFVTFSKAQARNHLAWHLGVEHQCPHCDMTFRKYTTLMGHIRIMHPSQYICGYCANSFVSEHGLNHHMKLVHKNNNKIIKDSDDNSCKDCNVNFVTNKIYIKHLLISPNHKDIANNIIGCRECGEQFSTKEILSQHSHKQKHTNNTLDKERFSKQQKYNCSQCDKTFSHPTSVYQHFIKDHPNAQYKLSRSRNLCLCELCGKTFMCQSKLLAHKMLHSGEKPYTCSECSKTFRTKLFLTKHINLHKGVKLHQCKVCGKQFSNAGNLFKHNRIHSGEKPFKCSLCSKAFVDSSNLKQHVQGVHYNVKRNRKR